MLMNRVLSWLSDTFTLQYWRRFSSQLNYWTVHFISKEQWWIEQCNRGYFDATSGPTIFVCLNFCSWETFFFSSSCVFPSFMTSKKSNMQLWHNLTYKDKIYEGRFCGRWKAFLICNVLLRFFRLFCSLLCSFNEKWVTMQFWQVLS